MCPKAWSEICAVAFDGRTARSNSKLRIAECYAVRMPQLVARIDAGLAASLDELVAQGVVESRSDAVRRGLHILIEQTRRRRTATAIVDGYRALPQTEQEVGWADEATVRMIAEEPW